MKFYIQKWGNNPNKIELNKTMVEDASGFGSLADIYDSFEGIYKQQTASVTCFQIILYHTDDDGEILKIEKSKIGTYFKKTPRIINKKTSNLPKSVYDLSNITFSTLSSINYHDFVGEEFANISLPE